MSYGSLIQIWFCVIIDFEFDCMRTSSLIAAEAKHRFGLRWWLSKKQTYQDYSSTRKSRDGFQQSHRSAWVTQPMWSRYWRVSEYSHCHNYHSVRKIRPSDGAWCIPIGRNWQQTVKQFTNWKNPTFINYVFINCDEFAHKREQPLRDRQSFQMHFHSYLFWQADSNFSIIQISVLLH